MKFSRTLFYCVLVAVAATGLGLAWPDLVGRVAYAVESGQASAAREQLKSVRDLSLAFQEVTKAVKPSVVNIRSITKMAGTSYYQVQPTPSPFGDRFGEDFFERFFGPRSPRERRGEEFVQRGVGTGVIVSADGYILTNNHVVRNADKLTVTLSDNREFDAEVIGADDKTDLAVVKIDASGLLPAELGDSDDINVGEWVLAMGNPFGLSQTVTAGIISAKGRANVGIADYEDFIQTDAAINPGNSGGPLVNLDGQVIGINTAIATENGGYQGVGFAIPANMARQIRDDIIKHGRVVRGWLGVVIQDLNEDLAKSFGFDSTDGVLVGDVPAGGPAAKAGLEPGDIIVKIDGKPVVNMNKLRNMVAAVAPGTEVKVDVFREGEHKTFTVKIGELDSAALAGFTSGGSAGDLDDLGLGLQTLSPEAATQLGIEGEKGVLVTSVTPGSVAERAGLHARDVIVGVGTQRVHDMDDFRSALGTYDLDAGVRLRVKSSGMQRYVLLKR